VVKVGGLEAAGMRDGDFLAFVDSKRIKSLDDLAKAVEAPAGPTLEFKYVRNGKMYVG
jgi:hypothetical protein